MSRRTEWLGAWLQRWTRGRPPTRLLHPLWEGQIVWVTPFRRSPEVARLARSLCLSLDYVTDVWHPVYAE